MRQHSQINNRFGNIFKIFWRNRVANAFMNETARKKFSFSVDNSAESRFLIVDDKTIKRRDYPVFNDSERKFFVGEVIFVKFVAEKIFIIKSVIIYQVNNHSFIKTFI